MNSEDSAKYLLRPCCSCCCCCALFSLNLSRSLNAYFIFERWAHFQCWFLLPLYRRTLSLFLTQEMISRNHLCPIHVCRQLLILVRCCFFFILFLVCCFVAGSVPVWWHCAAVATNRTSWAKESWLNLRQHDKPTATHNKNHTLNIHLLYSIYKRYKRKQSWRYGAREC